MRNHFQKIMIASMLLLIVGITTTDARKKSQPTAQIKFTSAYTDTKSGCRTVNQPQDGGDPVFACKGLGGYQIGVGFSAYFTHYNVERAQKPNEQITDLGSDCGENDKVEWRLANGKPFAVIRRVSRYKEVADGGSPCADKANRTGSTLVVKGLKGFEHIDFAVEGATSNANEKARQTADANYARK